MISSVTAAEIYANLGNTGSLSGDTQTDLLLSFAQYLKQVEEDKDNVEALGSLTKDVMQKKQELAQQIYNQCLSMVGKAWSNDDDSSSKMTYESLMAIANSTKAYQTTGSTSAMEALLNSTFNTNA